MTRSRIPAATTILTLALASAGLAGCGSDSEEAPDTHLAIVSSDSPDTVTLDATEGATVTLHGAADSTVELEVRFVEEDEVGLSTSRGMAPEGDSGGIDLLDPRTEFRVAKGEELQFSTPTMDGGTTWTTTLEEGPAPP